jgi:hypothetical protein
VSAIPDPTVVVPSPIPTHPQIAWRGADGNGFDHRCGHGRRYDDGCRGDDNGYRQRDPEVDTETNPGVYRRDSNSGQGQNCDCLFHNVYEFGRARRTEHRYNGITFL